MLESCFELVDGFELVVRLGVLYYIIYYYILLYTLLFFLTHLLPHPPLSFLPISSPLPIISSQSFYTCRYLYILTYILFFCSSSHPNHPPPVSVGIQSNTLQSFFSNIPPHSFYTCRDLHTLTYILSLLILLPILPISFSSSNNLTPHVLFVLRLVERLMF